MYICPNIFLKLSRPVGGTGGIHSTVEGQVDLSTSWLTWSYRCDYHLTDLTSELVLQLVQFKRSAWDGASNCSKTAGVRRVQKYSFLWNWHYTTLNTTEPRVIENHRGGDCTHWRYENKPQKSPTDTWMI